MKKLFILVLCTPLFLTGCQKEDINPGVDTSIDLTVPEQVIAVGNVIGKLDGKEVTIKLSDQMIQHIGTKELKLLIDPKGWNQVVPECYEGKTWTKDIPYDFEKKQQRFLKISWVSEQQQHGTVWRWWVWQVVKTDAPITSNLDTMLLVISDAVTLK